MDVSNVENVIVENSNVSIENVIETNVSDTVATDKDNVISENVNSSQNTQVNSTLINKNGISEFSSQGSGGMECSDSPDISSFSSSAEVSDSLDQFLTVTRKRSGKALKRAIIPSVTVAAASIVKRSKAVPGAGIQRRRESSLSLFQPR